MELTLAGAPRIYGQLVGLLGKYSKFASAGEKASVRQAMADAPDAAADGQAPAADATTHPDSAAEDTQTRPGAAP